jgi:tetratricopeptide (TPR) repeat protein
MRQLDDIKKLIDRGQLEEAVSALDSYLQSSAPDKDQAYYLYGNVCRKKSDWQGALNNYKRASDLNPKSPATHAYRSVLDILNFYNKDMYNQ